MNWWAFGSIVAAIVVVVTAMSLNPRPPYNHVLTSVERIDEDEDALRVYHDKVRGVTCYQTYSWPSALACTPDVWLSSYHNSSSMFAPDASPP